MASVVNMDGEQLVHALPNLLIQDQRASHSDLEWVLVCMCSCILRWATYNQCQHPFDFLSVHRSLDDRIYDYMFEESVTLLLRATWFKPLIVEDRKEVDYNP